MAIQDYTSFLGKRVCFTECWAHPDLPDVDITGRIVAVINYAEGYSHFDDGSFLFLKDGYEEPDFVSLSLDQDLHVIE